MRLNTPYHMRAVLKFADGSEFDDVDHTFTTGDIPVASCRTMCHRHDAGVTSAERCGIAGFGSGKAQQRTVAVVTDLGR